MIPLKRTVRSTVVSLCLILSQSSHPQVATLAWEELPSLPNPDGVAGPFVGVHEDTLILAGGANFPNEPLWETDKVWHSAVYVLKKENGSYRWADGGNLARSIAYGASVSFESGVLCMGGTDGVNTLSDVFLLSWNPREQRVTVASYPPLPGPMAYGSAVIYDQAIYLAGGQQDIDIDSAMANFWKFDLAKHRSGMPTEWETLPPWPGPPRAFNVTAVQHDGLDHGIYVMSGRNKSNSGLEFLKDVWRYELATTSWTRMSDAPRPFMAGTSVGWGQRTIYVLGGDDGSLFEKANTLRDKHPGFVKEALVYDTVTDKWMSGGSIPANHVTTTPVIWNGEIVIASGEVRPRVRSPKVWRIRRTEVDSNHP